MIGRAALKAMNSQYMQQRSVEHERQIQALHATLDACRKAEAVGNYRVYDAPSTPSARIGGNQAANAQPSSPPDLPSESCRRPSYPLSRCSAEMQTTSTPPIPPDPPVRLSSTRPALSREEGNQSEVEKEQSVPVVQVETQVLPESHPQTISQEGDTPDRVMPKGDSTAAANDPPSNPSDKGSVVPQNPTTTPPSNTSSQDILLMWS